MGVGGGAEYFVEVKSSSEMREALLWAKAHKIRPFILGKGSNLLFDDAGFAGLVILNQIAHFEQKGALFRVGAGYSFARLGIQTARLGFAGLEFACGVPGSVGGAVFMNAGAGGQETQEVLEEVEVVTFEGESKRLSRGDLPFSYRTSPFQKGGMAIVSATFRLREAEEARSEQLSYLSHRQKTQPLTDKSSGCIFRNPEGEAAGALIERCGLKGVSVGRATVSILHGNFIVNEGGATCEEVRQLIERVKGEVKKRAGVDLREEVRYISLNDEE